MNAQPKNTLLIHARTMPRNPVWLMPARFYFSPPDWLQPQQHAPRPKPRSASCMAELREGLRGPETRICRLPALVPGGFALCNVGMYTPICFACQRLFGLAADLAITERTLLLTYMYPS